MCLFTQLLSIGGKSLRKVKQKLRSTCEVCQDTIYVHSSTLRRKL